MHNHLSKLIAFLAALAAACGSGSGGTATMSVHLVDGPSSDYKHVFLDVREVSIHSESDGWVVLGTPGKVIDLLALTGGVAETLADGASLPAGHYAQMRLLLGARNSVQLTDGTTEPLVVPSGMKSGVKLDVSFDVAAGTTRDVFIDFDARRSVFLHAAGNSGKYLLRPVVRAVDRVVTGSIAGLLTEDLPAPLPLAGVTVTAQTVSGGVPTVMRTTTTAVGGSYLLDLLPVGATYHIVAQPVVGPTSYSARASGGITLTASVPTATQDLAFTAAAASGTLGGTIAPPVGAEETDLVSLVQSLVVAVGVTQPLVVRVEPGSFDGVSESYSFGGLPTAATYSAVVSRLGDDGAGNPVSSTGAPVTVTVSSSATTLDLTAP